MKEKQDCTIENSNYTQREHNAKVKAMLSFVNRFSKAETKESRNKEIKNLFYCLLSTIESINTLTELEKILKTYLNENLNENDNVLKRFTPEFIKEMEKEFFKQLKENGITIPKIIEKE